MSLSASIMGVPHSHLGSSNSSGPRGGPSVGSPLPTIKTRLKVLAPTSEERKVFYEVAIPNNSYPGSLFAVTMKGAKTMVFVCPLDKVAGEIVIVCRDEDLLGPAVTNMEEPIFRPKSSQVKALPTATVLSAFMKVVSPPPPPPNSTSGFSGELGDVGDVGGSACSSARSDPQT
jgi:hypothetical protein